MFAFNHFNFNVLDLERSLKFYRDALDLAPVRERDADDGSYHLCFLGDDHSNFTLELTLIRGRSQPYDLGEGEFHLALAADDFDAAYSKHSAMGCICQESADKRFYFIEDPDGYWIEIIHKR